MKCLVTLFASLAIIASGASAQTALAQPEYALETNIAYKTGDDLSDYEKERCLLDLYVPTDSLGFATVVWFHAGGLRAGERFIPDALRDKGIAVVAAGYRLNPQVSSPIYVEDAAAALAWTFEHIPDYGGSDSLIFVSGHSAGGYLANMITLDRRWLGAYGIDANRIAGLIPFSGHTITHFTVRDERGIPGTQAIIDDMAPIYHVRADAPPVLLITGDRDRELLGRYEENAYFWRMMQEVGHPNTRIFELDGFDHGTMAKPAQALLLDFVREISGNGG